MKKILLAAIGILVLVLCIGPVSADKVVTWNTTKLIKIDIRPIYYTSTMTFEVEAIADVFDDTGEYSRTERIIKMRSELPTDIQAMLDDVVKTAYKALRNKAINENNTDDMPPIE